MAALRLSHPGQPTELVDLGPGVGRTTHTRGKVYGGVIVTAAPSQRRGVNLVSERRKAQLDAAHARYAMNRPKCGKVLPIVGGTCARKPDHADSCRSQRALDIDAQRRRTGLGRWP